MTGSWFMLGGPLHGTYGVAGQPFILTRAASVRYVSTQKGAVITGSAPGRVLRYVPIRLNLPGWRVAVPCYALEDIGLGRERLEEGGLLPGSALGAPGGQEGVCRWCYGQPIPGLDTCPRESCILNVAWLHQLPMAVASDAEGWKDDA